MLLSNPAVNYNYCCFFFLNLWRGFKRGNDQFHSPEPSFPSGIKAGCDTFFSVSLVQLYPEATNLCLTWNRKRSPAVEKSLWNNAWMTKDLRLHSLGASMEKKIWLMSAGPLRLVQGLKIWDHRLNTDLVWTHNDNTFLFSYGKDIPVHSVPVQWYGELCSSSSSLWGHAGVNKEGHLGVSLLKAIAAFFISGFVQEGGYARYLVHTCLC